MFNTKLGQLSVAVSYSFLLWSQRYTSTYFKSIYFIFISSYFVLLLMLLSIFGYFYFKYILLWTYRRPEVWVIKHINVLIFDLLFDTRKLRAWPGPAAEWHRSWKAVATSAVQCSAPGQLGPPHQASEARQREMTIFQGSAMTLQLKN